MKNNNKDIDINIIFDSSSEGESSAERIQRFIEIMTREKEQRKQKK